MIGVISGPKARENLARSIMGSHPLGRSYWGTTRQYAPPNRCHRVLTEHRPVSAAFQCKRTPTNLDPLSDAPTISSPASSNVVSNAGDADVGAVTVWTDRTALDGVDYRMAKDDRYEMTKADSIRSSQLLHRPTKHHGPGPNGG